MRILSDAPPISGELELFGRQVLWLKFGRIPRPDSCRSGEDRAVDPLPPGYDRYFREQRSVQPGRLAGAPPSPLVAFRRGGEVLK
jgi:hypothetical protein